MSSRFFTHHVGSLFLRGRGLAVLSLFLGALCVCAAARADSLNNAVDPRLTPPVQNYADQALPIPAPQPYYDSPLAAGTLTLQDVLEAHKPNPDNAALPAIVPSPTSTATAPMLTPPTQSSSTSLMMSQGMRAVLQKVGETSMAAPSDMRLPSPTGQPPQAVGQPASLIDGLTASAPVASPAATEIAPSGLKYEPGQEPKNLAASAAPLPQPSSPTATTVPITGPAVSSATPLPSAQPAAAASPVAAAAAPCDENVQKWEKSCAEAGYPSTYVGKIVGETHTACSDNVLHDIWVSNTCTPPGAAAAQSPSTDAVCGAASNNEYDDAPTSNLCTQGVASAVSGSGPWTWACSGVNGGQAASCTARKRQPAANGVCGSANGSPVSAAPTGSDLCDSGYATVVKGSGPWTWSCRGVGGGGSQSCIAPLAAGAAPVAAQAVSGAGDEQNAAPVAVPAAISSASGKEDLCGAAAETLAYQAPDKDLCRVGSASVVNGDGPWSWACTDNEGRSSSCRTLSLTNDAAGAPEPATPPAPAPVAAPAQTTSPRLPPPEASAAAPEVTQELACGLAAAHPTIQAPTTELCVNGKASAVHGSGPWRWNCSNKAHRKVACETPTVADGSCGPANGSVLKSAPFAGLCASGTPTGIEGDGPWTWTCNGSGGGVNVSCAATMQAAQGKVEGLCGAAANTTRADAPVSGLCASGTPSAVSGDGPWNWSCSGSNGGAVSSCAASKNAPTQAPGPQVNGLCGAANGVLATAQPVDGLCASGAVTSIVGNGPWNWSCLGENGGMTVSCTAPLEPPAPIDGACGGASGVPTLVRPQSGLCAAGITGIVSGSGPWTWTCSGANGGAPASCVAPVAGRSGGALPSVSVASGGGESADTATASAGLVTPRLPPSAGALPVYDHKVIPQLTPSAVPPPTVIEGANVPSAAPDLSADQQPLPPPPISSQIASAPELQESAAERAAHIPGNHLTLDPTISTILFTRGSSNIDENVVPNLDRLAAVLAGNPDVRITLIAYADNEGSTPRDARRLSLSRALAVRDYLISKSIPESRVDVRAEGANSASGYIDRVDVRVNG